MTGEHPALPPRVSWPWLGGATVIWLSSAAVSIGPLGLSVAVLAVVGCALSRHFWIAVFVLAATATATLTAEPLRPMPGGEISFDGVVSSAVVDGPYGRWVLVETGDGPALIDLPEGIVVDRGDEVRIRGVTKGEPDTARGVEHRGVVKAREVEHLAASTGLAWAGNAIRERVIAGLEPMDDGRALLAGFLIGDISQLDEVDVEAMRLAGLSHFTAVSGSNVALFLGLLFLVTAPLSMGPRRRAVIGLAGLPVYAAATGFEPSVLRASVMAGLVLGGRLIGLALEAWQVLALAVGALVIIEPKIGSSIGFQLSVVATAGVLLGARWPVKGGGVARALAVTIGAQAAVAPLLLIYFGRLPLMSPVVNLVAAPLVTAATLLASVGVAGVPGLVEIASWFADLVLGLANSAAGWPQLGPSGFALAAAAGVAYWLQSEWRGVVAVGAAVLFVVVIAGASRELEVGSVVVLDVGQGDAILVVAGVDRYVLIDGGPDPVRLFDRLRRYGVRQLDLVVVSHVHADHLAGLTGLVGRVPIGMVWAAAEPHSTPGSEEFFRLLEESNIPVVVPETGQVEQFGGLTLRVLGPERRYASANDQSVVIAVEGSVRSILLAGDIEKVAQADLRGIVANVLKVPHHGATTSDPEWLASVGADLAVISVGPNDFGHPAQWVIDLLEASGTSVVRTDQDGDVVVLLSKESVD